MSRAIFEFFEAVAEELGTDNSKVLNRANMELDRTRDTMFDDLRAQTGTASGEQAVSAAVGELTNHFAMRDSILPFAYDPATGRFSVLDADFLDFVRQMRAIRSLGKRAADFERGVLGRLSQRATGTLHRVGFPRTRKKSRAEFNRHLKSFGFDGRVLVGKEKDGGFDILWALPLGEHPHRPLISVQCKNGLYDLGEAHKSVGTGSASLSQHLGLQTSVHVPCVLFNDYVSSHQLGPKRMNFVPLGLSDLAVLSQAVMTETL